MKRCWIALLVAWLLVEGANGQAGPVESDGGYDRECLMAILPAVSYSCHDRATRGPAPVVNGSAYSLLYSQSTRTLLGGFFQYCTAVGLKRPLYYLLPPTSLSAVLVAAADSMAAPFAAFPGDRLQKNFTRAGSLDALEDALLGYVSARSPSADGLPYGYDSVITPFSGLQELRAAGLLTGLAGISSLDTLYQRGDIHPTMLDTVSYAGELSAVPLDGSQLLLYVRTELLAASGAAGGSGGLRVPDSWEQLLAEAAAVNGSLAAQLRPVVNATGGVSYAAATAPVFGFCMQPHTHMLGALALAVLAPLVQTNGSDQGMYLNADTLRPAATTAAMPYVLSYLRRLAAYSAPVAFSARAPQFSNDFALGRCAMTIGTAAQFRRNSHAAHPAGPSAVIGRVTAALLPGSEFVVTDVERDWTSAGVINRWVSGNNSGAGVLRPCDARLCPASQLSAGSASSVAALGLAAPPPSGASQGAVSTSSQALVNRAPLMSPGGTVGGVYGNNAEVMPQLYTWTMLSALGGPVNSWQLLLLPVSELGPWRLSHMDTADNALARWRAAGYNAADTASFLTAARATLDHHNVVLPLRVRTAMLHVRAPAASPATSAGTGGDGTGATASSGGRRAVLQAAADNSTAVQQPQQEQLDQGLLEGLLASLAGLYGYGPTGSVAGTSSGAANSTNSSSNVPTREQMMQEYRRSLGLPYTPATTTAGEVQSDNDSGSNLPVGAVVGAVEGSTSLWEALPEEVMDRALRTHHVTVRTVGIFFGAYESATEGDSFILAFASATDAAQFALGLQRALLAARWPEELLEVPGCAPVYVRKLDWLAKANQVSLVPAPTRRLGSRPHAPTSKRSAGSAHAAEASAGLALPPAPGGFGRTGSAPPGHGPGLAGLGAGLLSRRWTSRRTSNDQAAIAAAMAAEEAAAQEGEGQGAATQEEDGMGPTAEEEELDAEVAAAVEAAAAAADPSQHGRATGGAAAGNRHLLGRFWAAMDAGGRPMQPMTSMRRRRRRSDTSLVAMMAAPYLERQSVPGHGDDQGDGGAGTPGGTGTGPGAAITDGTRKRSLRKFAMHGRQSVNVRGSPDLHVWSPGAGGGPLGGAVSLPTSPDDNPDNSMYGGRGTPGVGDGGRRARLKSIRHASVTFAAVAVAAISGSRAHDTGGGGGGGGIGSGATSGPGSPASTGVADAGSGPDMALTPRQLSRHARRGSVLNTMLGTVTALGSPAAPGTGTGSAVPAAGTTDGGLTFTGATAADARYPAGAVVTEAADSPHTHINSYSVVALSAALAASEYKAAAVAGADSTQLTGSIVGLPEPLTNSGLGHPNNASGPMASLLAGRALPGSGLPAEEVPPDALAAAAASPILTPAAPSPQATAASSGVQPPLSQARGRRASSFVPRLLNLALFEVVNGSSGGGGGPTSTSGSGGGNAPRSLKSQGSQMRRRYSTVLERALSPRGKSMAGNSAAAAAVSGGGSGGGEISDAATQEQAAVPGVSTWGSELGVEDGAEKWAELKWHMSGRRTGTVDAPAISRGAPRAFGGGAGATSGTTSRHSNLLTSSAAAAAGAAIAASSSTRPKLDIARVFSIAHMQDSSLPIAGRTSAANTGTTVVGAGSVRGGPDGTGGIDGLDFGRASPVPALSGGASPLFPPGLPPAFQDAVGIAATEGQQGPERKLAAAAAGLGLPSMSGPQGRSSVDSGGLPTRRTAPDMPHVEQLLGTPLQHSHSQPVRQHRHPPHEQHHQQERRVGPPQLPSASTCLPAPLSGAPSPMPLSQQSRTGAVSAMGFSETADAALADERWSLAGVIIGTGGASGQAASSSSHTAGATPPMVSAEPAQPRARSPAVPLSLLLPANSSAPGVAGIVSSAGGESLQLALQGSVGGDAEASACTASVPLSQRPARTFGPVFSPQPPAGSSGGNNALRLGGAQQPPAGSPSTSQLQQDQPVPGTASPGHRNPASSATNPNTPSSAAAGALSAARSSTSSAAAAAALHRRFSELAVELAKPVARASQHGQHFLTASGGADSTGSNGSGNAAAQSLLDGTPSATLPHLSASGAAAAAASQSGGSSRMARLEYTSSRRRVGAGMEPLERLEEETGGAAAQTVPLPQAQPQSPSASPVRNPPPRLRSSGAVAGTSADGNEPGLQPSAPPETGRLTPKGARGKSDGGSGGGEARVSKSGILPSALQLLLKRSGTGGSSRKAGAGGLLHLSDAASTESADLASGEDGSGHGRVPKSPARLQLAPRVVERDVPSAAIAPRLDLVEMTSDAGGANARPSGAGEAFGSAIVPLAEPPRAHSVGAGGVGVAAGSAALGFVKPSIIIPSEGPSMASLPQPFAHDQPALMSPDATAAAASVSFAALDTATSNIGPGPQHTEPLHTAPTNGVGRVGSITTHVPAARAVKPPTHGSLLELLHRVFVRVDGAEAAEGHKQRQNNQQHQQQRPADMQLVFAGLRVRVGLHCGVTDARDIQYNAATARMTFGGEGLRIAKAVCDCASGGQVVMSGEVLLRLQLAGSGGVLLLQQQQMLLQGQTHVLDLGDHQLLEAPAPQPHVSSPAAPPEGAAGVAGVGLAHAHQHNPAASAAEFTPGFMDAPVGPAVCVVVFRVSNAAALAAWNAAVASEAMALLELYLRASLGALINTSNTSGSNGDQAQPAESLGPQSSGRGGAASTPNRLACYLAAAPPGSPFGTFVAGFSQPSAAARWALTAVARTAELPWPAELLESHPGGASSFMHGGGSPPRGGAFSAIGGSVGSRMARLLRTAPGGWISSPLSLASHKGSGRHGSGTAADRGADSSPLVSGTVLLSLPPPARGGGAGVVVGGPVSGTEASSAACTEMGGWAPVEMELDDDVELGEPSTAGADLVDQPESQHSAVAAGGAGGSGRLRGVPTPAAGSAASKPLPLPMQSHYDGHAPSATAAAAMSSWDAVRKDGMLPPAAEGYGGGLVIDLASAGVPTGTTDAPGAASGGTSAVSAQLPPMPVGRGAGPAAVRSSGFGSPVRGLGLRTVLGGGSSVGGNGVMRSGGSASRVPMPSRFALAAEAAESAPGAAANAPAPTATPMSTLARAVAPTAEVIAVIQNSEIVVVVEPELAGKGQAGAAAAAEGVSLAQKQQAPPRAAAGFSTVRAGFPRSSEALPAPAAVPTTRALRPTHTSENGAEGPSPAAMVAAGSASGLGLSGLPPGARRMPSATGPAPPTQRLRNRLLQHLTLSFTSLSRKAMGGSPVAGSRFGAGSGAGDVMDLQGSAQEDAEVVSFRGLRVRLGMAVGPVRVELCPLTGRVVYSGKTVTTAMTSAASARLGTLLANQGVAEAIAAAQGGAGLMLQFPSGYHSSRQGSNRHETTRQDSSASHATAAPAPAASGPWRKAMFRRAQTVADEASAHAATVERRAAALLSAAIPTTLREADDEVACGGEGAHGYDSTAWATCAEPGELRVGGNGAGGTEASAHAGNNDPGGAVEEERAATVDDSHEHGTRTEDEQEDAEVHGPSSQAAAQPQLLCTPAVGGGLGVAFGGGGGGGLAMPRLNPKNPTFRVRLQLVPPAMKQPQPGPQAFTPAPELAAIRDGA
eukprot:XP_001693217.1 predicted protein [Chlamydomonas reinhardtii]